VEDEEASFFGEVTLSNDEEIGNKSKTMREQVIFSFNISSSCLLLSLVYYNDLSYIYKAINCKPSHSTPFPKSTTPT
jgi:hypothetical protein